MRPEGLQCRAQDRVRAGRRAPQCDRLDRLPDLDDAVVDEFVHAITRMQETMPGIKGVKNNGKRK